MKKMITSLLLLGSASALANQPVIFENLTYPHKQAEAVCLEEDCKKIQITVTDGSSTKILKINKSGLRQITTAKTGSSFNPYSMTGKSGRLTSQRYREAYYDKAVGNALLTAGGAIVDTAILPVMFVGKAFEKKSHYSKYERKGAETFLTNFDSGLQRIVIREKYYDRMLKTLYMHASGDVSLTGEFPEIIERFANRDFTNCYVKLKVDGWANQIYVNGEFAGNFDARDAGETKTLAKRLAQLIENGACY